jgi:hypothetical protein
MFRLARVFMSQNTENCKKFYFAGEQQDFTIIRENAKNLTPGQF